MKTRVFAASGCLIACTLLAACGSDEDDSPGLGEATMSDLQDAIDDGKPCADLIDIKNNMDPKSSDYEAAPAALQAIGCFSKSSTRTD